MKPATAPTERSMPPVMIAKVSPIARIAIIAPCRRRLAMLFEVQKVVVSTERASHMNSSRPSRVRPSSTSSRRAALAVLRESLISHVLWNPRALDPDRLGQNRFVGRVLVPVGRNQSARPEDVQRVGEFVDLRQV